MFVEGPCTIAIKSTDSANSDMSPGVLIINNGSLTLNGGATSFGVIYRDECSGRIGNPVRKRQQLE